MKLQWIIMAEGITQDARGAFTAVGIGQGVISTPVLPLQSKRAVIAVISGDHDELVPGRLVSFSISVFSPSDKPLNVNTVQAPVGPVIYPDLPVGLNLASEILFSTSEYGRHLVRVTAKIGEGRELTGEVEFHVAPPPLDAGHAADGDPPAVAEQSALPAH